MSLLDTWDALSDTDRLTVNDQVRVHVGFTCAPLAAISSTDLATAMQGQQAVASVLDVSEDTSDYFAFLWGNFFGFGFTIKLNPVEGVQAGDIRNAANNALSGINSTKTIPCGSMAVGQLEKLKGSSVMDVILPRTGGQAVSSGIFLAFVLVGVGLFFYLKKDLT